MALTDKLTAIADAIRAKTGKTDSMTLDTMPTEIEGISTGGGFPGSVVFTESNLTKKYSSRRPVLYDGGHIARATGSIFTSADGRSWNETATSISDLQLCSCIDGVWHGFVSNAGVYYSTDNGETWTLTNLPKTFGAYSIHKTHNIWYCFMSGSSSCTYYSLDGKTWTIINNVRMIGEVQYADGVYIGMPSGNGSLYRSTDGITWETVELGDGTYSVSYVCWYKGRWFTYINGAYYSDDGGVTWTEITDNPMRNMRTNGEVLVGYNRNDTNVCYSNDGETWTSCGIAIPSGTYDVGIKYTHGMWFIYSVKNVFYISLDHCLSWQQVAIPDGKVAVGTIWCDGLTLFVEARDSSYMSGFFWAPLFE